MAVIVGSLDIYFKINNSFEFKILLHPFVLFFLANLLLFIVYVPLLLLNPEINWHLKGEAEQDPKILMVYFPLVALIAAWIILVIVGVITKLQQPKPAKNN